MKNCEAAARYLSRMAISAQLFLIQPPSGTSAASAGIRVAEISARALTLGRSPSGDLVLPDERVSWQHATVWFESGVLWVKDLGSRNGTSVNGERLSGPRVVADGDRLQIGPAFTLDVRFTGCRPVLAPQALVVEDLATGLRYPMRSDRFTIGPAGDLDPGGPGQGEPGADTLAGTLLLTGPEDLWIGVDGEDRPLSLDEVFVVCGRRYTVRQADLDRSPTFEVAPSRVVEGATGLYELDARLEGAGGPQAVLLDPQTARSHSVEGENRAVLLYVLGRTVLADVALPGAERGWLTDEEATTAIWGRAVRDVNALHVLVHRLRKELAEAGFDPWFIEKRRRCVRARLARVSLDARPA